MNFLLFMSTTVNIVFSVTAIVCSSNDDIDAWVMCVKLWLASAVVWCILFAITS